MTVTYEEFRRRVAFTQEELLRFAQGLLIDDAPAGFRSKLPLPPMLMVDRVVAIDRLGDGGRARLVAERDVRADDWYFRCHFLDDPVQPGCLGVDGIWQLLGFYCAWNGAIGTGRALGSGEIDFAGQIRPQNRLVRYELDVVRYSRLVASGAEIAIGDGRVVVDGEPIYAIKRAKVGIFRNVDGRPR